MRKKILVISHERSGTHFLINTIAQCFDYVPQQIDIDGSQGIDWSDAQAVRQWVGQFKGRFVANIFKSHHAAPILSSLLPEIMDEFIIFYIRRDGRDVMTSFWTYLNKLKPGWGPQTKTVGAFMRANAMGGIAQYQAPSHSLTMLERWAEHIGGWAKESTTVHHFSYEELHLKFDATVDRVAEILEQPSIARSRPSLDAPSSLPWRGEIGTWREFFTSDDEKYFDEVAKQVNGLRF